MPVLDPVSLERREMKTYTVMGRSIQYMTYEIEAENEDQARELAEELDAEVFNPVFEKYSGFSCAWDIYSVEERIEK